MMEAKATVATLLTVGALVGGVWAADERWAKASDMRSLGATIAKQIEITRLSGEVQTLEQRRSTVVDKIYDGAVRGVAKPAEKAIAERYQIELKDVDNQLRDKRRQVDQLKVNGKD